MRKTIVIAMLVLLTAVPIMAIKIPIDHPYYVDYSELMDEVNKMRNEHGVNSIYFHSGLTQLAIHQTTAMKRTGNYSHDAVSYATKQELIKTYMDIHNWQRFELEENIKLVYEPFFDNMLTVEKEIAHVFNDSSAHHASIMSPYAIAQGWDVQYSFERECYYITVYVLSRKP